MGTGQRYSLWYRGREKNIPINIKLFFFFFRFCVEKMIKKLRSNKISSYSINSTENYIIFNLQRVLKTNLDILQAKLVKGTLGEVKFLTSRKSSCTQF